MNNVYLHNKDNLKSIMLKTIFALFPLIIAGFYKNGIKLYINNLVGIYGLLKPILFDIIGLLLGILVNIIYEKIKKSKLSIKESIYSSFHPLYGLLIASVISINTNIFLFSILTFIVLLISKFFHRFNINIVALTSLIIIFITKMISSFTYLNIYEQSNTLTLNSLDYLIGRGSGGINTTHVIFLIISLLFLNRIKSYKKDIPLYTALIYSVVMFIYLVINNNVGLILDDIFANGILFSFIFIAPLPEFSSYTSKGKFIYSLIVGLSTFGLYLIYPPLSALGGILIGSICHKLIDKLVER